MEILNIEFKAATDQLNQLEAILQKLNPIFIGEDHQVDTYFNVPSGRLKLREGNIENALIHYQRENTAGSKLSHVLLYQHKPEDTLKEMLVNSLGVKAVVDKTRRIYVIENVKFHFDKVNDLGTFIEVEAIDKDGTIGRQLIQEQCDGYAALFNIADEDFVAVSYSDLVMQRQENASYK